MKRRDEVQDQYQSLRELPLAGVLQALGVMTEWKSRKGGQELFGKCPLHEAKRNNTSFSFHADGRWNCFSCGKKGRGAIDLAMALRSVGFQPAVELLRPLGSAEPSRQPANPSASTATASSETPPSENPPFKSTYEKYKVPSVWLQVRGLTQETLDRFCVFQYSNPARRSVYNGSVLLKMSRWSDGETVGYLSRNIGEVTPEKPKYSVPKGLVKTLELFGAWQLKDEERGPVRVVYLVESPFSVMHFHQLGFPAVSPYGWMVSREQAAIIGQLAKGVVFLPDQNKRKEAAQYAGLLAETCWVKMPEYPADDPEKLTKEEIQSLA